MKGKHQIEWEIRDGIGIITISSPPENYLYEPAFVPLESLKKWTADPSLKGILIHGKGKHFSAGGDLDRLFSLITDNHDLKAYLAAGTTLLEYLIGTDLPLVAAIQGVCFGGGLELALACHIRIAAENALFASPETGHGLIPGMGGTVRLPETVGQAQALRMILTGDMINAEEARMIGLIDIIVPRHEVFDYAFNMLRKMTDALPVKVIRSVLRTLRNATTLPAEQAITEENRIFCELAKEEAKRRSAESEKNRGDA
ncbi:MAG: enoyl-CoA hydratase/isomerase family protein [Bacteroidetes bacterium]|nr:MAG: enoyl-CoA hydratase/isomerase family protein [Bacteroidota bacterium]